MLPQLFSPFPTTLLNLHATTPKPDKFTVSPSIRSSKKKDEEKKDVTLHKLADSSKPRFKARAKKAVTHVAIRVTGTRTLKELSDRFFPHIKSDDEDDTRDGDYEPDVEDQEEGSHDEATKKKGGKRKAKKAQ